MRDRIPKYAGRVRLVPVEGSDDLYDIVRADEPIEQGTPLNANTFLSEEAEIELGLDEDSTPNDAFLKIAEELNATMPITRGGTGATNASSARSNLSVYSKSETDTKLNAKAPSYTYSQTDLTAGESSLTTGKLYFVYE